METISFLSSLGLTVILLGVAIATGLKARRRLHLTVVGTTVATLGLTIYLALQVGKVYDIKAAGWITPVHLTLARVATASFLLPVATGLATLKNGKHRRKHRYAAFTAAGLTVLSAITGAIMLALAKPL